MKSQWMISDGLAQHQRQLPALSGDYFQLDDLRFDQLLTLANEYARLMHFFRLDLEIDGNWQQFFSADESILMATILAIDTEKLTDRFEQRLASHPNYRDWFRDDIVDRKSVV